MYRTVTVELTVKLVMKVDDGVQLGDVIDELDYSFTPATGAIVDDTEIVDYEVKDSR